MNLHLIQFLRREMEPHFNKVALAAVLSGVANTLVIVVLNEAADHFKSSNSLNIQFLLLFVLCVAVFMLLRKYVSHRVSEGSQGAVYHLRMRVVEKIRRSRLIDFEGIDRSQIITALTEHSDKITQGGLDLSRSAPAVAMLLFSFVYIGMISLTGVVLSLACIVLSVAWAMKLHGATIHVMSQSIKKQEQFFSLFHQLLNGFKELKASRAKRHDLAERYLVNVADDAKRLQIETEFRLEHAAFVTFLFFYVMLGANVFVLPQISDLSAEAILNITTMVIFITGNIVILAEAIPSITKANVAIENILKLEELLEKADEVIGEQRDVFEQDKKHFGKVELDQVVFHYMEPRQGKTFTVGPASFEIHPREVLFLTGGNGSGKSTLLKLITGLYIPKNGVIRFNGTAVTDENISHYRELYSTIFTDFHLFDRLYGMTQVDKSRVDELIRKMRLEDKTGFEAGSFTDMKLSTGQRKRLALIVALLEDRPVYVFDEVGADQDPDFRRYFYQEFLHELKEQGKAVIVVSHDDHYFHVADRVLKMEYGRIV